MALYNHGGDIQEYVKGHRIACLLVWFAYIGRQGLTGVSACYLCLYIFSRGKKSSDLSWVTASDLLWVTEC
jgi:hypothetical protein